MFSNKHKLFQQLRKVFLNVFFFKAKISFRCKIYLCLGEKQMEESTMEKEEKMDYFNQEREPVESAAARIVESDRLQVHVDVVTLGGRNISLREWK